MQRLISPFFLIVLFCLYSTALNAETATVQQVVDGDTLWVRQGAQKTKVRLLCVDTLEKRVNEKLEKDSFRLKSSKEKMLQGGNEASRYLQALLRPGETVDLRYEREKYDQYGRTLAHVYSSSGIHINLKLVEDGVAGVLCYAPNDRKAPEFIKALHRAKDAKRGLWGKGMVLQERWIKYH